MTNVKLTEMNSVSINTVMEKNVLMMLLYNNELSSIKIGKVSIYLHNNAEGEPDVEYGDNFRISKAKVDIVNEDNLDNAEYGVLVDVPYIAQQLIILAPSLSREDGDFSYIDWDKKFVTISTNLSDINSRVRFKLDDVPTLKSENVEICSSVHPEVENIGFGEDNMFHALITSSVIKAKLFVDTNNPLNTYTVEV